MVTTTRKSSKSDCYMYLSESEETLKDGPYYVKGPRVMWYFLCVRGKESFVRRQTTSREREVKFFEIDTKF